MIVGYYNSASNASETEKFNQLTIDGRKEYLDKLDEEKQKSFIKMLRRQAVIEAWSHERDLIEQGACTRDWTTEQIEIINVNSYKPTRHSASGF